MGMKIGLSLFAVAAAALLAVGCGGDKGGGEDEANYDGWMLTRWKDGTALTGTVYLQLGEDGTFTLYQSIGTFGYARFTGTYALVGDPATGVRASQRSTSRQECLPMPRITEVSDRDAVS